MLGTVGRACFYLIYGETAGVGNGEMGVLESPCLLLFAYLLAAVIPQEFFRVHMGVSCFDFDKAFLVGASARRLVRSSYCRVFFLFLVFCGFLFALLVGSRWSKRLHTPALVRCAKLSRLSALGGGLVVLANGSSLFFLGHFTHYTDPGSYIIGRRGERAGWIFCKLVEGVLSTCSGKAWPLAQVHDCQSFWLVVSLVLA